MARQTLFQLSCCLLFPLSEASHRQLDSSWQLVLIFVKLFMRFPHVSADSPVHIRFKYLKRIPLLLLLNLSLLVFLPNIKTSRSHSNPQMNSVTIKSLAKYRRRFTKINDAQTNSLVSMLSKCVIASSFRFINFPELSFTKFEEYINKYIEFRPPPALLS